MNTQVIENMSAEEYHALERLSASGIKKLLVSAQDFWVQSWMNPKRKVYESDTLNLGTAYHVRVLEGRQAFDAQYAVKPECDRRTKEGKQIFADWQAAHPDAEPIEQDTYDEINAAAERIAERLPHFKDGKPEVTVLWEDPTGVPMKARFDYLGTGIINDLKTFSNSSDRDLVQLIASHIGRYGYHIQAAVYREAHRVVFGNVPDFNFVFQQTGAVNNHIARAFPTDLLVAQQGRDLMQRGITKFALMYQKYGTAAWYDDFGTDALQDTDFPIYMIEG